MEEMFKEKNVVNNVDKFMGTMTKWPVQNTQNITKHGVYKDATDIKE